MSSLIPVDPVRCQAMIKEAHNPFAVGHPPPRWERCARSAVYRADETTPGEDGRKGAMSMCAECKVVAERQLRGHVAFTVISGRRCV